MVRTRYAPSPSGTLHIGGARTALFSYLYAKHFLGKFVLRVEDTDASREVEGSEDAMLSGLQSLGIVWDEGPDVGGPYAPYHQSERLADHRKMAEQLLQTGAAYRCYCTAQELEQDRAQRRAQGLPPRYSGRCRSLGQDELLSRANMPYVVRFRTPRDGQTTVHDLIRGTVSFDNQVIDDFVVMKADFTPVYNFAVVVDDHGMDITHVIRGEEHLSNTPKQLLVYNALGWEPPQFAHLPMILAPDRSKLSKRHGATAVEEYMAQGILPEALTNYLLLLGWSSPTGEEIMTLDEAQALFDFNRVQHTAAIYDVKKLEWMTQQYLKRLPIERVVEAVIPFIKQLSINYHSGPNLQDVVALVRERASTLVQLADGLRFFYEVPDNFDPKGVQKHFSQPEVAVRLRQLAEQMATLNTWDHDALVSMYDELAHEWQIKRAELIHPTRLALTGKTVGPGLFELVALLGKEASVSRLKAAAQRISETTAHSS